jgi:invasion protein IalB
LRRVIPVISLARWKGLILQNPLKAAGLAVMALVAFHGPSFAQGPTDGQTFGDWGIACPAEGGGECNLVQQVSNSKTNEPLLLARVVAGEKDGKPAAQLMIVLPLGVLLPNGLGLQVDDGEKARVPFLQCLEPGCHTIVTLDGDSLAKFKAGRQLTVEVGTPNGKGIKVPVSLSGFTDGLAALAKAAPKSKPGP